MSDANAALDGVIGQSAAMAEVIALTRQVAASRASVLIIGETGTGKEVIARAVHNLSPRADGPYIRVNCGALHENLLESELFGHVKGAFTGAIDNKAGRFEAAHGGSIFLDEISSTSPQLQVKLLRVLQEREFERVGDARTIEVDVRVIAATNESLEEEIEKGNFREDLYYRLNVVPIPLPPLRERREDIPLLAKHFLKRYCEQNRRPEPELTSAMLTALKGYDWPGNVRELENTIERLVVLAGPDGLGEKAVAELGRSGQAMRPLRGGGNDDVEGLIRRLVRTGLRSELPPGVKLYEYLIKGLERSLIEEVMRRSDNMKVKAADRLGINRNTLHKKLEEFGKAGDAEDDE